MLQSDCSLKYEWVTFQCLDHQQTKVNETKTFQTSFLIRANLKKKTAGFESINKWMKFTVKEVKLSETKLRTCFIIIYRDHDDDDRIHFILCNCTLAPPATWQTRSECQGKQTKVLTKHYARFVFVSLCSRNIKPSSAKTWPAFHKCTENIQTFTHFQCTTTWNE